MEKAISTQRGRALREWLKRERTKRRITMRVLAGRLGVPFQLISKVEKGERRLDVVEYIEYCEALGVDPTVGIKRLQSRLRF